MFHVIKLTPCGETYQVMTIGFNIQQALLSDLNNKQIHFGAETTYVANISGPQLQGPVTATSMKPLNWDPENNVYIPGTEQGQTELILVAN